LDVPVRPIYSGDMGLPDAIKSTDPETVTGTQGAKDLLLPPEKK
jgi:hypothetical protein